MYQPARNTPPLQLEYARKRYVRLRDGYAAIG